MDQIIWPCTITPARYSGVYEGKRWTAFYCYPEEIPNDPFSDDITASTWWSYFNNLVGLGDTPNEAFADLKLKIESGVFGDAKFGYEYKG